MQFLLYLCNRKGALNANTMKTNNLFFCGGSVGVDGLRSEYPTDGEHILRDHDDQ